jgi:hypothetical protein
VFKINLILLIILIPCLFSCESKTIDSDIIYCKVTPLIKSELKDSILFSSNDIKSFNTKTGEIVLYNKLSEKQLVRYGKFRFYLGSDSLFTAKYACDYMSSMVDDLVLYYSLYESKIFLQDGYPMWNDNSQMSTLREQNKAKRKINWDRFIDILKANNKID